MIDFDRFVFFGETPTEWLQAHLYDPGVVHWWDVAFTLVYTSYFIVPFALAGVPLGRATGSPSCASPGAWSSLALAGLATYIALPGGAALDGGRNGPARRRPPHHRARAGR